MAKKFVLTLILALYMCYSSASPLADVSPPPPPQPPGQHPTPLATGLNQKQCHDQPEQLDDIKKRPVREATSEKPQQPLNPLFKKPEDKDKSKESKESRESHEKVQKRSDDSSSSEEYDLDIVKRAAIEQKQKDQHLNHPSSGADAKNNRKTRDTSTTTTKSPVPPQAHTAAGSKDEMPKKN